VNKKLRVCDICGSFLSILDSDKRLADHFMGKQHIGYQLMRDTLEAIKTRRETKK
jgi:RNA-binding protein Luc7-like 2